jgi:methylmalonyl-CoA mutase C-terminal domain/subunit
MLRIVVATPGAGDHDHEAMVVARALRDAGHEVIYAAGRHQTAEQIVETALQEDADLVGLPGAPRSLFERLTALLRERGAADVVVFGSGTVPEEDLPALAETGVARVFTPDVTAAEITRWVAEQFREE